MGRSDCQVDVLVLGEHPCAYLAAALLCLKSKLRIVHGTIPGERISDRLVLVNPALYALHALLRPLRRKIEGRPIYGLRFVADDAGAVSEHRSKSALACVAQLKDIHKAMQGLAKAQKVELIRPGRIQIHRIDEQGIEMTLGKRSLRPKAMVLAGPLSAEQHRLLGVPEEWERGVLRRYTFAKIKGTRVTDMGPRALAPMSLDLRGMLSWAWLLPGQGHAQAAVEQGAETIGHIKPIDLLNHWVGVLQRHGIIKGPLEIAPEAVESMDMPAGGALAHEGLANRTLLIGPAGGFYSGSGEDVYPNCWSAIYAAEVLKKALKEPHLQDALQPYRQRWRTTLGDYLRGPQQNLRFLLPLVYRNQVMANRLAEAILMGRSVVR